MVLAAEPRPELVQFLNSASVRGLAILQPAGQGRQLAAPSYDFLTGLASLHLGAGSTPSELWVERALVSNLPALATTLW